MWRLIRVVSNMFLSFLPFFTPLFFFWFVRDWWKHGAMNPPDIRMDHMKKRECSARKGQGVSNA
jgi:hypothetical protein